MEKEFEKLKKQLEKCEQERDEYLDGWKRARADFLNYKKEEAGRIENLMWHVQGDLTTSVLPALDDIERAEKGISEEKKKEREMAGVIQAMRCLREALKKQGVEEIIAEGKKFNPEFHEAVGEVEMEGKESGYIAEVVEKGYLFRGKLLRPAKVRVTK